jgi:hypothetical protein
MIFANNAAEQKEFYLTSLWQSPNGTGKSRATSRPCQQSNNQPNQNQNYLFLVA